MSSIHRPQWSYARAREVCGCGAELPCPTRAAMYGLTLMLPTLAGKVSVAPLLTVGARRLLDQGTRSPNP